MIKKVALVTIRNEMKNMYYEELNSIFFDYIDFVPYSLEVDHKYQTDKDYLRSVDVILLSNANIIATIKHMLKEDCKIVYLNCAFLKNKIESLKTFPPNTNALVCFNFHEISNQAATAIYEMGITNLNLSVYNFELTTLDKDYDIAIVGENSALVPEKINTIFSLGRRKVSFSTLINLAVTTNILDAKLNNRILEYSKDLALPSTLVNSIYNNSLYSNIQLLTIMDSISYSIIILNNEFKIVDYNKNLVKMFNISADILNKQISDVVQLNPILNHIVYDEQIEDILIEIKKNKSIMLSIRKINKKIDNDDTYIVLMKDVTDTIKLENTLKKQLENKGHITKHNFSNIYGDSKEIKECIHKAKIIAKHDKPVLIIGESGTGKELFAQSIHSDSLRKTFPFVGINCAALSSNLLESELFGYEEGTFTGAIKGGKAGLFEVANNGTLFLDEIGDMSLVTQAKILRVLEEKEFMRLGSNKIISINVRIIAATNRDLRTLIKEGKFRLDLYYRLNTLMFKIPPLRKRKSDIQSLIKIFLESNNSNVNSMSDEVFDFLLNHSWNGNIRELKNCIDYMVSISDGDIKMNHLPDYILEDIDSDISDKQDILYLLNSYDQEILMDLIRIIAYTGGGRRSIYRELKLSYDNLSEYKLRKLIDLLVENNFIATLVGRGGMRLTDSGKSFISSNNI